LIDCFFCTAPQSEERQQMAERVWSFWQPIPWVRLRRVTPELLGCELKDFNRLRREFAEREATTPEYILTDDDCLPESDRDILKGVRILEEHENFGMLSAWPKNATINRWTPENWQPYEDAQVMEVNDVGGLRFIRSGVIQFPFPESNGVGYDRTQSIAMRRRGYRVGYLKSIKMEHLGEGRSEVWQVPSAEVLAQVVR
jgi:hypothetical protein